MPSRKKKRREKKKKQDDQQTTSSTETYTPTTLVTRFLTLNEPHIQFEIVSLLGMDIDAQIRFQEKPFFASALTDMLKLIETNESTVDFFKRLCDTITPIHTENFWQKYTRFCHHVATRKLGYEATSDHYKSFQSARHKHLELLLQESLLLLKVLVMLFLLDWLYTCGDEEAYYEALDQFCTLATTAYFEDYYPYLASTDSPKRHTRDNTVSAFMQLISAQPSTTILEALIYYPLIQRSCDTLQAWYKAEDNETYLLLKKVAPTLCSLVNHLNVKMPEPLEKQPKLRHELAFDTPLTLKSTRIIYDGFFDVINPVIATIKDNKPLDMQSLYALILLVHRLLIKIENTTPNTFRTRSPHLSQKVLSLVLDFITAIAPILANEKAMPYNPEYPRDIMYPFTTAWIALGVTLYYLEARMTEKHLELPIPGMYKKTIKYLSKITA